MLTMGFGSSPAFFVQLSLLFWSNGWLSHKWTKSSTKEKEKRWMNDLDYGRTNNMREMIGEDPNPLTMTTNVL